MTLRLAAIFRQMPEQLGFNRHNDVLKYEIVKYSQADNYTLVWWRWGAPPPKYDYLYGQNLYKGETLIKAVGGSLFQPTGRSQTYSTASPWTNIDLAKGAMGLSTELQRRLLDPKNCVVEIRH